MTLRPCACLPFARDEEFREVWANASEPATYVRMWLDIGSDCLWHSDGCSGIIDDLPISDALASDIRRWAVDYDDEWDRPYRRDLNGGPPEMSPAFPHDWFDRRGDALAERMRTELGPTWTVIHAHVMRPEDFERRR